MKVYIMKQYTLQNLKVLMLSLILISGVQSVSANPTASPTAPNNQNVPAPITTSSDNQIKGGSNNPTDALLEVQRTGGTAVYTTTLSAFGSSSLDETSITGSVGVGNSVLIKKDSTGGASLSIGSTGSFTIASLGGRATSTPLHKPLCAQQDGTIIYCP